MEKKKMSPKKIWTIVGASVLTVGVVTAIYWCAIEFGLKDYENIGCITFRYEQSGSSDDSKKAGVTITRISDTKEKKYPKNFVVPNKLLGRPVVAIGEDAFSGLDRLETVTLPKTVTSIGEGAFRHCENLREVRAKGTITSMGSNVFEGSTNWEGFHSDSEFVMFSTVLYRYQGKLTSDTVILGEEEKDQYVNTNQYNIVTIPENVSAISAGAFEGTDHLVEFYLPERFDYVPSSFLKDCEDLKKVDISTAKTVNEAALSGCTSLEEVNMSEQLNYLGTSTFENTALKSFEIPSSITALPDSLFAGCKQLEDVTLPSTLTRIGFYSFDGCSSLKSINLPENLSYIGQAAFRDCGLETIEIPAPVSVIQSSTFEGCEALTSVHLQDVKSVSVGDFNGSPMPMASNGIVKIGERAFYGCKNLKQLQIPYSEANVDGKTYPVYTFTTLEISAFEGSGLTSFVLPPSVKQIDKRAFANCADFASIEILDEGEYYISGTVGRKDSGQLNTIQSESFLNTPALKEFVTPDSVQNIYAAAFSGSGIERFVFPNNEKFITINSSLFENCTHLAEVTIPDSVNTIRSSAFAGCTSLQSLTISSNVRYLEKQAFAGSTSLQLYIPYTADQIPSTWNASWKDGLEENQIHYAE